MSYTKYYYYKKQQSSDNGLTWTDVYPSEMIPSGTPIGTYETLNECEGVISNIKFRASYNNATSYSVECDASSAITTANTNPTGYEYTAMTSAEIGECATGIDAYAFGECYSLTSVTIPDSVTSIGEWAFGDCSGLTNVTIPNRVTVINDRVFNNCRGLTSVTIPDSVTSIGEYAFAWCYSLSSVTIPNGVTSIDDGGFITCTGLTRVNSEINGVCNIPSGLTSISEWCFANCSGFTSVNIPNNVTSIGDDAFYNCIRLTSVTIPDSVTSIGEWTFGWCSGLTNVTIPASVTSIGGDAFCACLTLTSVTCLATTPPTLGTSEYGVFNYTNNCPIYVPCASLDAYKTASGWSDYSSRIRGIPPCGDTLKFSATYSNGTSYSGECDSNSTLTTGNTHPNGYTYTAMTSAVIGECVTSIGTSAFTSCTGLTEITIPNTVTSIGNRAFARCSGLTNVIIPSSVTEIKPEAFARCTGLTEITIPNSVQTIGYSVFTYCTSLTNVTIGTGITSLGNYVFDACTALTSITINATTPPTIGADTFRDTNNCPIYVPCDSVAAYKAASGWSTYADRIVGIPPCGEPRYKSCTWSINGNMTAYTIKLKKYDSNSHLTESTISQGTARPSASGTITLPSNCKIKEYPPSSYTFDGSDNYSSTSGVQQWGFQFLFVVNQSNGDNLHYFISMSKLSSDPTAYITFVMNT